jgi:hypothetical protein
MLNFLAFALASSVCLSESPTRSLASDSLKTTFEGGQRWSEFYPAVNRRRELWERNWTRAKVPDSLLARAQKAGPWRILVITEPGCSDSANSVPYISRLVESVPTLDLRLVNSTVGKPWMEAHRTPDGRAATPTVLVLDANFRVRGCWVEQPKALQDFWLPIVARKETSAHVDEKLAWYAKDEGREILREIVEVIEGARTDTPVCRRG